MLYQDYTLNQREVEHPKMFDSILGAWIPCVMDGPTGLTVWDLIGASHGSINNATLSTFWSLYNGRLCWKPDGSDDFINLGTSDIFNFTSQSFSIVLWIVPQSAFTTNEVILSRGIANSYGYYIQFTTTDGSIRFATNAPTLQSNTWATVLSVGVLYQLVFVRAGSDVSLFMNGLPITRASTTAISTITGSSGQSLFLSQYSGASLRTDPLILDCRIYSYPLDASLALLDYNLGPGGWLLRSKRTSFQLLGASSTDFALSGQIIEYVPGTCTFNINTTCAEKSIEYIPGTLLLQITQNITCNGQIEEYVPGTCAFLVTRVVTCDSGTVEYVAQTLAFETGGEITCDIGILEYEGGTCTFVTTRILTSAEKSIEYVPGTLTFDTGTVEVHPVRIDRIVDEIWHYITRTLQAGSPPIPVNRQERIAKAIWDYSPKTLTSVSEEVVCDSEEIEYVPGTCSFVVARVLTCDTQTIEYVAGSLTFETGQEVVCDSQIIEYIVGVCVFDILHTSIGQTVEYIGGECLFQVAIAGEFTCSVQTVEYEGGTCTFVIARQFLCVGREVEYERGTLLFNTVKQILCASQTVEYDPGTLSLSTVRVLGSGTVEYLGGNLTIGGAISGASYYYRQFVISQRYR